MQKVQRLFENFLVVGIEKEVLEYLTEKENLLNPKIIHNYPNMLIENDLKLYDLLYFSHVQFLKHSCFKDGVPVKSHIIKSIEEYDQIMLENNFFAKPKEEFCLVQQVSPDSIDKYFIFCIKFDDFYIKVK